MNSRNVVVLNGCLLLLTLVVLSFYFESAQLFIYFFAILFIFFIIGNTFYLYRPDKMFHPFIVQVALGLVFFVLTIFTFSLLRIADVFLYALIVVLLIVNVIKKTRNRISWVHCSFGLKKLTFTVVLLLFILSVFLMSNRFFTIQGDTYVKDGHILYEQTIANSLALYPWRDISYAGKDIRLHFGYPLLNNFLNSLLRSDALLLNYKVMAVLFLFVFINLLVILTPCIAPGRVPSVLAIFFTLFCGYTLIPLEMLVRYEAFILNRIFIMNSFVLGFIFLLLFLIFFLSKRGFNQYSVLENLIITALLITRFPFFLPIIAAVMFASVYMTIVKRKIFTNYLFSLVVGFLYFYFFMSGAHEHNIWKIWPGFGLIYNSTVYGFNTINTKLLILLSFIYSVFIAMGIMVFSVLKRIMPVVRGVFKRDASLLFMKRLTIYLIIMSGILGFIFFNELKERNNIQFLLPSLIILKILFIKDLWSLKYFANRKLLKGGVVAVLIIILFVGGLGNLIPSEPVNPVVQDNKLTAMRIYLDHKMSLYKSSIFRFLGRAKETHPKEYLDMFIAIDPELRLAFELLNNEVAGVILTGKHYDFDISGFKPNQLRSALSHHPLVMDDLISRGIIVQNDVIERFENTLNMYYSIVDEESKSDRWNYIGNKQYPLVDQEVIPFSLLKQPNAIDDENRFWSFLNSYTSQRTGSEEIQEFIFKFDISYIVFEDSEVPSEEFLNVLNLRLKIRVGSVSVYSVGR